MHAGAVGDRDAGGGLVADAIGDGDEHVGLDGDLLACAAEARIAADAHAGFHVAHARADAFHDAGDLGHGREGQRRLVLVFAARQQRIEEVEGGGLDAHDGLAGARHGIGQILDDDGIGTIERLAKGSLHVTPPEGRRTLRKRCCTGKRCLLASRIRRIAMTVRMPQPATRGYFAIGAERISKSLNLGNMMRSAHGFGASFTFTVGATYRASEASADTSKGQLHLPHYNWGTLDEMRLPHGCKLVGIELVDEAIDLPSFRHPLRAAYVLGPERGVLSEALLAPLRLRRQDTHEFLHQRGDGGRHRDVRSRAYARAFRAAPDFRRRADRGGGGSRLRGAN